MLEAWLSEMLCDRVVRSAALQGLQIYILGHEVGAHNDTSPEENSLSEVVLAISLRGPGGVWPPPRPLLQMALRSSLGVEDIYSALVPPEGDEYDESLMLLHLLLRHSNEYASALNHHRIRLLWLEEPVEIVLEPRSVLWTVDIDSDRRLELVRHLAPGLGSLVKAPLLQYCGVHEAQPAVREAQWLPAGPLEHDEIAFDLGGEPTAGEGRLRFTIKGAVGPERGTQGGAYRAGQ